MSWLDGLRHRIRAVLDPGAYERELQDEMRLHVDLDAMQQRDANRARRRFGNRTYYQEEARRMTWLGTLDVLRQDFGYSWRSIRRTPGFAVTVVLTLALGIGVNAAMFSFLDRLFLRPPAGVLEPSDLRRLWTTSYHRAEASTYQNLNYPSYLALKDAAASTAELALYIPDDNLRMSRAAPPVHAVYATSNYFDVAGVRPAAGRPFGAGEDVMGSSSHVVVVSHPFWKTQLGGDSAVLGKSITLGLAPYTVIGILPPDFVGLDLQAADIWIPFATFPRSRHARSEKPWYETTTTYGARAVMRAKPGFDDDAFAAQATVVLRRVEQELRGPDADARKSLATGSINAARGPGELSQETLIATRIAGVAIIVLLIACANVVNLLLARAVHRRREIAVRLALGVSRSRLVRLLTMESVLLSLLAAGAAMLAAWWGGGVLRSLLLPDVEWIDSALDGRVVAFALGVAMVAGVIAGLIPAVQASNPQLSSALKSGTREGGTRRSRLRSALVIVQAAFSVVLLAGAALFVRTLQNVRGIDIGYDVDRTALAEVQFERSEWPPNAVIAAAMRDVAARMENHAGVERVGRTWASPMRGYGVQMFYTDIDSAGPSSVSSDFGPFFSAVSPGFFAASGLPVMRGRTFSGGEYGSAINEVILNDAAARTLYPGRDPLGHCIRFAKRENPCHTVVGVVENTNTIQLIEGKKGHFYVPLGSHASGNREGTAIVLRVSLGALASVRTELGRELRRAFPLGRPLVMSMDENLEYEFRSWRVGATLFTAFGLLALLVALVGIYSTVSYTVGQRTHEFGVRIALGARVRDVLNQVLGEGLRVVAIGVACGIVLALAAGRLVRALLFGVESSDPSAMVLAACSLLLVAALATLVPAWRAARVDPVTALRAE